MGWPPLIKESCLTVSEIAVMENKRFSKRMIGKKEGREEYSLSWRMCLDSTKWRHSGKREQIL